MRRPPQTLCWQSAKGFLVSEYRFFKIYFTTIYVRGIIRPSRFEKAFREAKRDGRWLRTRRAWVEEYVEKKAVNPVEQEDVVPVPVPRGNGTSTAA